MKSRFSSSDRFAGLLITLVVAPLSGSFPFEDDSIPGLMFKVSSEAAADVSTLVADIPQVHAAVINKASPKGAALRDQSSAGFTDAVKMFLAA